MSGLIGLCLERNIPFVAYRLPDSQGNAVIRIQESGRMLFLEDAGDITSRKGFVYAPFHRTTNMPVIFFEPELVLDEKAIGDSVLGEIRKMGTLYPPVEQAVPDDTARDDYDLQARKMIASFGPDLSKVVLSRIMRVSRPAAFDPGRLFQALSSTYPGAFVHLAHIPGAGTWMGATPEVLFRSADGVAFTTALAGTRRYMADNKEPWGGKELEEQHLVSVHIEEVLRQSGISGYDRQGPETVNAGNLQHLSTRFTFGYDPAAFDVMAFLKRLHPTPAVSGLPVAPALDLIRQTEQHNREYYAGFCGPVDLDGPTDLFVNLRCMKVLPRDLVVYAGGGLTSRSVAGDEWKETGWKAKTLLNLI